VAERTAANFLIRPPSPIHFRPLSPAFGRASCANHQEAIRSILAGFDGLKPGCERLYRKIFAQVLQYD
jgi:hypothetical protein